MSKTYVAHKFRLKPTKEQAAVLKSWSSLISNHGNAVIFRPFRFRKAVIKSSGVKRTFNYQRSVK